MYRQTLLVALPDGEGATIPALMRMGQEGDSRLVIPLDGPESGNVHTVPTCEVIRAHGYTWRAEWRAVVDSLLD